MKRFRAVAAVCACILACLSLLAGCQGTSNVVPYLPPSYYDCTESTPNDLINAYYGHYNALAGADIILKDRLFVFKRVAVTPTMVTNATDKYVWIEQGLIKCYFLSPAERGKLKAGQPMDMVGINKGSCADYTGTLFFEGCVFLPPGVVKLPASEGPVFTASY